MSRSKKLLHPCSSVIAIFAFGFLTQSCSPTGSNIESTNSNTNNESLSSLFTGGFMNSLSKQASGSGDACESPGGEVDLNTMRVFDARNGEDMFLYSQRMPINYGESCYDYAIARKCNNGALEGDSSYRWFFCGSSAATKYNIPIASFVDPSRNDGWGTIGWSAHPDIPTSFGYMGYAGGGQLDNYLSYELNPVEYCGPENYGDLAIWNDTLVACAPYKAFGSVELRPLYMKIVEKMNRLSAADKSKLKRLTPIPLVIYRWVNSSTGKSVSVLDAYANANSVCSRSRLGQSKNGYVCSRVVPSGPAKAGREYSEFKVIATDINNNDAFTNQMLELRRQRDENRRAHASASNSGANNGSSLPVIGESKGEFGPSTPAAPAAEAVAAPVAPVEVVAAPVVPATAVEAEKCVSTFDNWCTSKPKTDRYLWAHPTCHPGGCDINYIQNFTRYELPKEPCTLANHGESAYFAEHVVSCVKEFDTASYSKAYQKNGKEKPTKRLYAIPKEMYEWVQSRHIATGMCFIFPGGPGAGSSYNPDGSLKYKSQKCDKANLGKFAIDEYRCYEWQCSRVVPDEKNGKKNVAVATSASDNTVFDEKIAKMKQEQANAIGGGN